MDKEQSNFDPMEAQISQGISKLNTTTYEKIYCQNERDGRRNPTLLF